MKSKDRKTAKVDLAGAASVISTMYALGFDDDTDENAFWEKRAILEKYEDAVRAAEREACAKIAEADTSFMMLQDFGMQQTCTQVRTNIADAIRNRKP